MMDAQGCVVMGTRYWTVPSLFEWNQYKPDKTRDRGKKWSVVALFSTARLVPQHCLLEAWVGDVTQGQKHELLPLCRAGETVSRDG